MYTARVVGETPLEVFSMDAEALQSLRGQVEVGLQASAVATRGRIGDLEAPLHEMGTTLFSGLFSGSIGTQYNKGRAVARSNDQTFGVALDILAPELAMLPWETMYDPAEHEYLCESVSIIRRIPVSTPPGPMRVDGPIRILGIVSNPTGVGLDQLDADSEKEKLAKAMSKPVEEGRAELFWARGSTYDEVHDDLLGGTWHVIHFIGHGGYDEENDEGFIYLADEGRRNAVGANRVARLFLSVVPPPRLVVLNSCSSALGGAHDVFSSTAATLVQRGISAVAAMQFAVSDPAAAAFSAGFYRALASGREVDNAVREGRARILGLSNSTLEFVTPLLYLQGSESRLFDIVPKEPRDPLREDKEDTPPVPPVRRPKRLVAIIALSLASIATLSFFVYHFINPAPASASVLPSGAELQPGESLTSQNGKWTLLMQGDGNLVEYSKSGAGSPADPTWSSNTPGHNGAYALMQTDGNLVVYPPGGGPPPPGSTSTDAIWAASGSPESSWAGAYAELENNGVLDILASGSTNVLYAVNLPTTTPYSSATKTTSTPL